MENNNQPNNNINEQFSGSVSVESSIQPEDKVVITPVRTYADDVRNVIEGDNMTMTQIAMAEARKMEEQARIDEEANPSSVKNKKIIAISIGVLILGIVGVAFAWHYATAPQPEVKLVHRESLVPYDEEASINLQYTGLAELYQGIQSAMQKKYDRDTNLVLMPIIRTTASSSEEVTLDGFKGLMDARMSDALVRALGQKFMFGIHRISESNTPTFMILKIQSFDSVFAGMLDWETSMADDIGSLFFKKEELLDGGNKSAILADSLSFKDEVVNNKDVRALRTKSGKLLMYYTYISEKVLLIGRDFETINEISKRLATSQFKQ